MTGARLARGSAASIAVMEALRREYRSSGHENGLWGCCLRVRPVGSGDWDGGLWENAGWAGRFCAMGFEPGLFIGRPCDLSRCASSADPSMSFAHRFSMTSSDWEAMKVRDIGLDVHLDFCEVAICENGSVRSAGRVATTPESLQLFAQSLAADDRVALEVTANSWEIARILEPRVARVIVVSPSDTGMRQARAKTDRLDARTLARLLASGELDAVWVPDRTTWVMRRRLSRRGQLVHARTRVKNEIHAVLVRQLVGRPPVSDLFGAKGRAWLAELELPVEERETIDSGIRQVDFLDGEIAAVERLIAQAALESAEVKRLMNVPGVNVIVAASFLAAIGEVRRFRSARNLVRLPRPGPQGLAVRRWPRHAPAHLDRISPWVAIGSPRWNFCLVPRAHLPRRASA